MMEELDLRIEAAENEEAEGLLAMTVIEIANRLPVRGSQMAGYRCRSPENDPISNVRLPTRLR